MHSKLPKDWNRHSVMGVCTACGLTTALALVALIPSARVSTTEHAADLQYAASTAPSAEEQQLPTLLRSQAQNLARRIARATGSSPSIVALADALEQRSTLLQRSVTVMFQPMSTDGSPILEQPQPWTVSLGEHPNWLSLDAARSDASYRIDLDAMTATLSAALPPELAPPVDAIATDVVAHDSHEGLLRATIEGEAQGGYIIDYAALAQVLNDALEKNARSVSVPASWRSGTISVAIDGQTHTLQLLSSGKSNFKHSPWGRKTNIRKGLDDRWRGVMIPSGTTVSFNDAVGPISAWRGWQQSLAIFDGWRLENIIGGGICQVATTVYRGMLLAGLPIPQRKSHSLYVSYYKDYGVGLDATVMPGKQDFTFTNDTPDYLLVESFTDGDDATVNVYGVNDGRTVSVDGPYFASTAPDDFIIHDTRYGDRGLGKSEIGWTRTVRYADGHIDSSTILSTYNKGIPIKSLLAEYPSGSNGMEVMHAAAPKKEAL